MKPRIAIMTIGKILKIYHQKWKIYEIKPKKKGVAVLCCHSEGHGPPKSVYCILVKKAGILAGWNLYIGILRCEISILVFCLNWNCYFETSILVYWLIFQVYWFFEIWYIGISDPLVQDPIVDMSTCTTKNLCCSSKYLAMLLPLSGFLIHPHT